VRSKKKSENIRSLEGNRPAEGKRPDPVAPLHGIYRDREAGCTCKRPDQVAPLPSENVDSVPEFAPEVLTGGHGGPIPALIVRLVRSLFTRDSK